MYSWVLALHIIAIVCWFAALFYLPRLFVYHTYAVSEGDERGHQRFEVMERRLYRGIMNPSMIAVLIFGIWLVVLNPEYYLTAGWFYTKAALVVILIGYHHMCLAHMKKFINGKPRSHIYYRIFNEVPTLILLAIVILSVVKPY